MSLDEYVTSIKTSPDLTADEKAQVVAILTSRPITPSVLDEVQAIIDNAFQKEYAKIAPPPAAAKPEAVAPVVVTPSIAPIPTPATPEPLAVPSNDMPTGTVGV